MRLCSLPCTPENPRSDQRAGGTRGCINTGGDTAQECDCFQVTSFLPPGSTRAHIGERKFLGSCDVALSTLAETEGRFSRHRWAEAAEAPRIYAGAGWVGRAVPGRENNMNRTVTVEGPEAQGGGSQAWWQQQSPSPLHTHRGAAAEPREGGPAPDTHCRLM